MSLRRVEHAVFDLLFWDGFLPIGVNTFGDNLVWGALENDR